MSTGAVRRLGHERARTRNRLQPSLTGHGLEGRALYTELVPRLHEIELAGTPEYMPDPVRRRTQTPPHPLHDHLARRHGHRPERLRGPG
ncbi:hypothetical protein FMEAI12_3950006 [Parafrankia sp. Ea1.12]|nr:hypothetical protein FMEAI12_3950006 [Parafrankia sp. Ea1.12]